jgi:hypothetical protein
VIAWTDDQHAHVRAALEAHPIESGRCAQAAQAVLSLAIELDPNANALVIEPTGAALYLVVKGRALRWYHHVTVAAARHHVDALTGPDGHPDDTYLDTYFEHAAEYSLRPVEADEWATL